MPSWDRCRVRLAAPELGQPPGAFALDQCTQGLPNQRALLVGPGQALSFQNEIVIQGERCPHFYLQARQTASNDDYTRAVVSRSWIGCGQPLGDGASCGTTTIFGWSPVSDLAGVPSTFS